MPVSPENYVIKYTVPGFPEERTKTFSTALPHVIEQRFMRANPKAVINRIVNSRTLEEVPLTSQADSQ